MLNDRIKQLGQKEIIQEEAASQFQQLRDQNQKLGAELLSMQSEMDFLKKQLHSVLEVRKDLEIKLNQAHNDLASANLRASMSMQQHQSALEQHQRLIDTAIANAIAGAEKSFESERLRLKLETEAANKQLGEILKQYRVNQSESYATIVELQAQVEHLQVQLESTSYPIKMISSNVAQQGATRIESTFSSYPFDILTQTRNQSTSNLTITPKIMKLAEFHSLQNFTEIANQSVHPIEVTRQSPNVLNECIDRLSVASGDLDVLRKTAHLQISKSENNLDIGSNEPILPNRVQRIYNSHPNNSKDWTPRVEIYQPTVGHNVDYLDV